MRMRVALIVAALLLMVSLSSGASSQKQDWIVADPSTGAIYATDEKTFQTWVGLGRPPVNRFFAAYRLKKIACDRSNALLQKPSNVTLGRISLYEEGGF